MTSSLPSSITWGMLVSITPRGETPGNGNGRSRCAYTRTGQQPRKYDSLNQEMNPMATSHDSAGTDTPVLDAPQGHRTVTPEAEANRRTAADIRRDSDARRATFVAELKSRIEKGGEDGQAATRMLLGTLEFDVRQLTEQRNRAEDEVETTRTRERETFDKLMDAWKGWAAADSRAQRLQRTVDRREGINWPAIFVTTWSVLFGIYLIATALVGA